MPRRVLVVDDEKQIRAILRAYLASEGFQVQEAASGAQALHLLSTEPPDLVLLDIGLPDLDGLEVLRTLRKSFSPREVVARVKAVLRRTRPGDPGAGLASTAGGAAANPDLLQFDGVTVDTGRREVRVDGIPATLTALEFDLLVALAASPGRVYSRAQLLEKVWGYDFFGDERVVDVHIRGMRKALSDDATSPRIIGTVRSVGYKFLLDPVDGVNPARGGDR